LSLSAKTTTYERPETTASTVADYIPLIDWSQLTQEEMDEKEEQKKKDNKLHIKVKRKDLFNRKVYNEYTLGYSTGRRSNRLDRTYWEVKQNVQAPPSL